LTSLQRKVTKERVKKQLMDKTRDLTEAEIEYVEMFLEYTKNVVSIALKAPVRLSHSLGDLTMHFYIELNSTIKK
jgi:hypothetical protein